MRASVSKRSTRSAHRPSSTKSARHGAKHVGLVIAKAVFFDSVLTIALSRTMEVSPFAEPKALAVSYDLSTSLWSSRPLASGLDSAFC